MRFITKEVSRPEMFAAFEEGIAKNTIWLYKQPKTIYILKNASINYLDREYAESVGYRVVRSGLFRGKETSIVTLENCYGLFVSQEGITTDELVQKYYVDFWKYISTGFIELENKGNDLVVAGTDRKILGMVNTVKDGVTYGHCMFLGDIPNIDLNRLFKMPEDKFEGKTVKTPEERITSFKKETGQMIDTDWLITKAKEYFNGIGIVLEEKDDFSDEEKTKIEQIKNKHLNEEWITKGDILGVAEPMEAFQKYISNPTLSEEDDALLLAKFKGKLPTAEKELEIGKIMREKNGNN